eukprot:TRINITY_DN1841_c0_g1_i1.p1 TRINITY_DN1841_c0_g1~~TRINITY_DN1841_c0_g1_i1.p1  ORF type:complete len:698 (+),score=140.75 TRINITY_DN1841_c0_g1_i1:24-2096(+)
MSKPVEDTGAILNAERSRASFPVTKLTEFLAGGTENQEKINKWAHLFEKPIFDTTYDNFLDRPAYFRKSVERSLESFRILRENSDLLAAHSPVHGKGGLPVSALSNNHSGIGSDHFGLFALTILSQGTAEQQREWLPRCFKLNIIGCYAQTELGHGSNVRGLETTATYDEGTQDFIINSPTLTARKWWPGALGVLCTHAIIYARLILKGKDYGYHAFVVQLRDEHHKPLPGVEVGDIGPKMAYAYNDSGFCSFTNVRVPRFNMLAKYQQVNEKGEYIKPPRALSKIGYLTMTRTRVGIVRAGFSGLARGVTIAIRYNAIRKQGFADTKAEGEAALASGEVTILDYQIQQYRLFSALANSFALWFVSRFLTDILRKFQNQLQANPTGVDDGVLSELHAASAGLKAYTTEMVTIGLEQCRQCCGGQGYALSGGIAGLLTNYLPAITYEGDKIPMALQTARYLVRAQQLATEGKPVPSAVSYLTDTLPAQWTAATLGDVRCGQKLLEAFRWSAKRAVQKAAAALDAKRHLNFDRAWNDCQVLLIGAANAHIVLLMVHAFVSSLPELQDEAIAQVMRRLCALFALVRIKEGSPSEWCGFLSGEQYDLVEAGIAALLKEIRPDAVALVDAFGFSDQQLGSCIGRADGKVYEALVDWAGKSPLNEPEYQNAIWNDLLKQYLDQDYLAKGKLRSAKL